ncbi:FeoB-associated Cys-rich membrane protein [Aquimarina rhabdastrellae]
MEIQEILVGIVFIWAVGFLIKKFFFPIRRTKKKSQISCGSDNCGCH